MASGTPGARMTSSVSINISTPSFYNPQKKFAPVVAPKPKLNPFKAGTTTPEELELPPPPAVDVTPIVFGSARAHMGRVGEIPAPPEDLPLPPPPPLDDDLVSPTSSFPPPPPAFEEPFPPAPEDVFPSPPPLDADAAIPNAITISVQDPQPRVQLNSIERDIDSFSSMLADMEAKDPFRTRATLDSKALPEVAPTPPKAPAPVASIPAKFSPKPVGFSPKVPLVDTAPVLPPEPSPSAPWAARPQNKFAPVHVPAISKSPVPPPPAPTPPAAPTPPPPPAMPAPAPPPAPPQPGPTALQTPPKFTSGPPQVTAKFSAPSATSTTKPATGPPTYGPGNSVRMQQNAANFTSPAAPSPPRGPAVSGPPSRPAPSTQSPGFSYAQQKARPTVQEKPRPPGSNPIPVPAPAPAVDLSSQRRVVEASQSRPSGGQSGNGLNMKEVEELENLTRQLMKEMDNPPPMEAHTTEFCGLCRKPLSRTQPAVRALEQLFHVECFTCFKCEKQLQGQQFYDVDGKPFCEECYAGTLEKCSVCKKTITDRMLRATGNAYHPQCFTCVVCSKSLEGAPFIVDQGNQPHCVEDYHRKYAPRCSVCGEPIMPEAGKEETVRVVALEKNFHMKCYKCEDCGKPLSIEADESGCYPLDGHVLCIKCHTARVKASR